MIAASEQQGHTKMPAKKKQGQAPKPGVQPYQAGRGSGGVGRGSRGGAFCGVAASNSPLSDALGRSRYQGRKLSSGVVQPLGAGGDGTRAGRESGGRGRGEGKGGRGAGGPAGLGNGGGGRGGAKGGGRGGGGRGMRGGRARGRAEGGGGETEEELRREIMMVRRPLNLSSCMWLKPAFALLPFFS
jgi:hypothetical protein